MVTCTGHIGIHEGADGRTLYVRTDVHDVMAIKLLFAAVRRIAANRCFHGSPVFDSFYGDASTIRAGFC